MFLFQVELTGDRTQ